MTWLRRRRFWMTGPTLAAAALLLAACGDDGGGSDVPMDSGVGGSDGGMDSPDGGGGSNEPYTQAEVQDLFDRRGCTGGPCHDSSNPQQGMDLTDFVAATVNVQALESDLDRIEPGDHQLSYLWHKVNGTHTVPPANGSGMRMPRGGPPLPDEEIARLAGYIDALPVE